MAGEPKGFEPSRCLNALSAIEADLHRLTESLTEAGFHAPTRADGWSAAYCIEHLVLTGQAFLPKWDAALKAAAETGCYRDGPFPYGWWHRMILQFAEPPYRVKAATRSSFVPCARRPMDEVIRRFKNMHREVERRIEMSRGVDAGRVKVESPFVSWVRYPLGFSFDIALAHERRHLWQAWQTHGNMSPSGSFLRTS
ncbi:MAG: DinB family protein [Bryobacteraceae bacterium]